MNILIEEIPNYKIAYLRQTGPYGQDNVSIMEQLKYWAESNNLLTEQSVILGIAHDNPEYTAPEECRYDTCLVISEEYCIEDENIMEGSIDGGIYAVIKMSHTAEAVEEAWQKIFPDLFKQGYQMDEARPIIERYQTELVRNHYCELCVPISENNIGGSKTDYDNCIKTG
ncbi:MAG: gyrI-like small molecule binding domain protein [Herbinix sp.]|nr:gyrI-like small molecule binding domain protein [Herbinix sp.]